MKSRQDDDGRSVRGLGSHIIQPYLRVCVCLCVCVCVRMLTQTFQTITHTLSSSPCEAGSLSLSLGSSGGQHAPLSQVGVQSVENAELLFRLKHQQLLQHLARIRTPARQQLKCDHDGNKSVKKLTNLELPHFPTTLKKLEKLRSNKSSSSYEPK